MMVAKEKRGNNMNMQKQAHLNYIACSSAVTPLLELLSLLLHPDSKIRAKVAENPRLPVKYFSDLVLDESTEVRIALVDNPSTPSAILEKLAQDSHPDVRYAMAENANIPFHLLNILCGDENPYVVARAKKTIERLKGFKGAALLHKLRCVQQQISCAWPLVVRAVNLLLLVSAAAKITDYYQACWVMLGCLSVFSHKG